MKLIDKLFPGFKPYHRVNMKQIIRRGFDDVAADDAPRPYNRPDFEAARAQYEAGVRAETERRRLEDEEEERREKNDGPDPADRPPEAGERGSDWDPDESDDDRRWDAAPDKPWDAEGGPSTGSAGVSPAFWFPPKRHQGIPDPPDDYESRPGRRIGLSRWERKAIEKGHDLGWDCGIPP